ncbi:MAG: hypothetical protein DSY46_07230 [Hydrogenimonas sp.]|nr:MAG: hypothetical protein DSY46_07230 [Hydrogenimonas sp.]
MDHISIDKILSVFKNEYGIILSKLAGKKIIFEDESRSIVVAMPFSKVYPRGNGWVDLTKVQVDLFKSYMHGFIVFRLSSSSIYYVDMKVLLPLLTQDSIHKNTNEGEHWKLDIWLDKISIRKSDKFLSVKENDHKCITKCL